MFIYQKTNYALFIHMWGFTHSSVGKESACNSEIPVQFLGQEDPLDKVQATQSLVAQQIMHLPAMWETWVRSLGWKDPLEKGKATHSSILA